MKCYTFKIKMPSSSDPTELNLIEHVLIEAETETQAWDIIRRKRMYRGKIIQLKPQQQNGKNAGNT
jgi:hypothetical protein